MPLKLRPTGLGSGIDKDRPDYTVFTGEWEVGRIYETRGGPDNLRWFWSMTVNGPRLLAPTAAGRASAGRAACCSRGGFRPVGILRNHLAHLSVWFSGWNEGSAGCSEVRLSCRPCSGWR
jgi:hypothetical protein